MNINPTAKELIKIYLSKKFTKVDIEGIDTTDFKSILSGIQKYLTGNTPSFKRARLLSNISMYNDAVDMELYELLSEIIANSTNGNVGIAGTD